MRSDEDNSCPCGDRLDLAGPRSYRVRDYSDADLESDMGMTVSHKAALLIGLAYLACAVSVALYPRSLLYASSEWRLMRAPESFVCLSVLRG